MSNTVEAVEGERQSNNELGSHLKSVWHGAKRSRHRGAVQVQAQQWSSQVCGAEEVEGTRESHTSDTGERREQPGNLWAVDGEMWTRWAVLALCYEDLVGVFRRQLLCCYGSGLHLHSCGGWSAESLEDDL